jgi:hypothetical protein
VHGRDGDRYRVRIFVTDGPRSQLGRAVEEGARTGRAFRGRRNGRYTGPTKQGILGQPGDADELSEPLAFAVVKVESISAGGA